MLVKVSLTCPFGILYIRYYLYFYPIVQLAIAQLHILPILHNYSIVQLSIAQMKAVKSWLTSKTLCMSVDCDIEKNNKRSALPLLQRRNAD